MHFSSLKGSEIRKRYILLYSENLQNILGTLDAGLARGGCKRKFRNDGYAIYLANQNNRDRAIDFINGLPDVRTVITSGTIRKCKSVMKKHIRENSGRSFGSSHQ